MCKKQRGVTDFPQGCFREAKSGKGYWAGGQEATVLTPGLQGMAGWARVSLLTPGLSFPKCKRAGVMSQMPPELGRIDNLRMWVKGQRRHVTISWLFKILLVGSSSFLKQKMTRGREALKFEQDKGIWGRGGVRSLKLTSATYRLHGLGQMALPLPAFRGP